MYACDAFQLLEFGDDCIRLGSPFRLSGVGLAQFHSVCLELLCVLLLQLLKPTGEDYLHELFSIL